MKNKTRLISLMLAGTIATSGVAGLTGCSKIETLSPNSTERKNLTVQMSLDANQQFFNVAHFDMELKDGKHYITFLGHYDEGKKQKTYSMDADKYQYIEHKDYLITYEISKEDYQNIAKFYNKVNTPIHNLTLDNVALLQSIVDNYDPINVEENTIEVEYAEHSK